MFDTKHNDFQEYCEDSKSNNENQESRWNEGEA